MCCFERCFCRFLLFVFSASLKKVWGDRKRSLGIRFDSVKISGRPNRSGTGSAELSGLVRFGDFSSGSVRPNQKILVRSTTSENRSSSKRKYITYSISKSNHLKFYIFYDTQCLEITEKVSFNLASEASYIYISSGQKFIENAKTWSIWWVFENLKLEVKQCYQTGQFKIKKNWWKMPPVEYFLNKYKK